jgi:hypothetical protein
MTDYYRVPPEGDVPPWVADNDDLKGVENFLLRDTVCDEWYIRIKDNVGRVPDAIGLCYLDVLFRNPNKMLGSIELIQLLGDGVPLAVRG